MAAALLELAHIGKRFPGVVALSDVTLTVGAGEIVALIGENGAGKSTLMKILGGVHRADEGEVRIDGQAVSIASVADATAAGVGFVHQELNNLDNLDVAGNIFLGREPTWGRPMMLVDRKRMVAESRVFLEQLGLKISPRTPLANLSLAQQQMVEIAKALSLKARVLILDEPTSSLTAGETETLLNLALELKRKGVSIIYISHRLGEVQRIADRVVALRDGKNAGELAREEISHERMVQMMVGRALKDLYTPATGARGAARLEVKGVRTRAHPGVAVSLEARAGEILGVAGLVGAGRSELAQGIFGVDELVAGEVWLDGKQLKLRSARDAIGAGIYLVPEDRRKTGLLTEWSVKQNVSLPGLGRYASALGLVDRRREKRVAEEQVASLRVKTPSIEAKAANLSGGNQQKVVLAKWLALEPKVLIVDEPTRGIDVGAKSEIYRLMRQLADRGTAVVMISSDLEEVLGVSDRIAVMHEGELAGTLERAQFGEQAVMNLAFGKQA